MFLITPTTLSAAAAAAEQSGCKSFASFIAELVDNGGEFEYLQHDCGALYAFIYNILQSDILVTCDETSSSSSSSSINSLLTIDANVQASFERVYRVANTEILHKIEKLRESLLLCMKKEKLCLYDVGITIVMMLFGMYMSRGQYEIMIGNLNVITEIEQIELYIESNVANSLSLGFNLSTDQRYSIAKQFNIIQQQKQQSLTMRNFKYILQIMCHCTNTLQFIQELRPFHLRIVESFYALTSISKCKKFVRVCREMYQDRRKEINFNYKFEKIIPIRDLKVAKSEMDWWFEVPSKAVWFVYFNGAWRLHQRYLSRATRNLFDSLSHVKNMVVFGFIEDDVRLIVVRLENITVNGKWDDIIRLMEFYNLYCPLKYRDSFNDDVISSAKSRKKLLFYVKSESISTFRVHI